MTTNNTSGLPSDIHAINQKIEPYRIKPEDSFITKLGKRVRKHFSSDYKSIKSQLVNKLNSQDTVAQDIKDRLIKKASLSDIDNALTQIQSKYNKDQTYNAIVGSENKSTQPSINTEHQGHTDQSTENATSSASNSELLLTDFSEIAKDSFDRLNEKSSTIHKKSDLYKKDEIFGGMRYLNISPPKSTAVNISVNNTLRPIHANYVGESHIATQGPMTPKANQDSIPAFFSMAMEQESSTIVNLTNKNDAINTKTLPDGRVVKSENNLQVEYWPAQGKTTNYSLGSQQLTVTTQDIEQYDGYKIVTLKLERESLYAVAPPTADSNSDSGYDSKEVKIFHFTEWPDKEVPAGEQLEKFNQFTKALEEHSLIKEKSGHSGKKIIHCKAGVGRTGTMIVLEQLKQGIRSGQITRSNFIESIEGLVMAGRENRGEVFVQRPPQLKMLFELGSDELKKINAVKSSQQTNSKIATQDIEYILKSGQITDENKALTIGKNQWKDLLQNLTTEDLKALALRVGSTLSSKSEYQTNVRNPALEVYAEKRVPELIEEKNGIKGARNYINNKYKNDPALIKVALEELDKH